MEARKRQLEEKISKLSRLIWIQTQSLYGTSGSAYAFLKCRKIKDWKAQLKDLRAEYQSLN